MKCQTPYCRNTAIKDRKLCGSCRKRIYRKKYPIKATYQDLRNNAKRRGKEFTLTFEEFKTFCVKTEYIINKGRTKEGFTIDRIDQNEGYHIWNIQVLSNTKNVKKFIEYKYNNGQMEFNFREESKPNSDYVPF